MSKAYFMGIDTGTNSSKGVPVSYTHLDVYKRQTIVWTRIWSFSCAIRCRSAVITVNLSIDF